MAKAILKVNIGPKKVLNILNEKLLAVKIDSSVYEVSDGRYIINVVYEKGFFIGGNAALIVTAENICDDFTKVKLVTAATGADVGINIGPGGKFRKKAIKVLEEYIINKEVII